MTAALKKGEEEVHDAVAEPKVEGESKKVGDQEEDISKAKTI